MTATAGARRLRRVAAHISRLPRGQQNQHAVDPLSSDAAHAHASEAPHTHPTLAEDAAAVRRAFGGRACLEPLCVLPSGRVFGARISGMIRVDRY